MTREIMAEGGQSPDIELPRSKKEAQQFLAEKVAIAVKKHAPEKMADINPDQVAQEMLQPSNARSTNVFTPEHPFGTKGQLPKAEIRPEQTTGMAEMFVSFGPFRPDMSSDEIGKGMSDLIERWEGNPQKGIDSRMSNVFSDFINNLGPSPAEEITRYREYFDFLVAAKVGARASPTEIEEIRGMRREFISRMILRAAECAVDFGSADMLGNLVANQEFKTAFRWAMEKPEVREAVVWIEKTYGECFRAKDTKGVPRNPVEVISEHLQKSGLMSKKEADLAANLTVRLYISTADITRFVGPQTTTGQPVERQIIDNIFKIKQIDMKNDDYWREWVEQWQKLKYDLPESELDKQLLGNPHYLWSKLVFAPLYLAKREKEKIVNRELVRVFDSHLRPLSYQLGCKGLIELDGKLDEISSFYFWSVIVKGSDSLIDAVCDEYLSKPLVAPITAFDDPKEKMPAVLGSLLAIGKRFGYLERYGSSAEPGKVRTYILGEVLSYVNTEEGQRLLGLKNKLLGTYRYWGEQQFYWAIMTAMTTMTPETADSKVRPIINEDQAEFLFKHFHAAPSSDISANIFIKADKLFLGGMGRPIWTFIRNFF